MSRAERLLTAIIKRRRVVLAVAALAAIGLAPGIARLETDNSPRAFFLADSPAVARYDALRQRFGSDQVLRIAAHGEGLWRAEGLAWLAAVERAAAGTPGVTLARGLAGWYGGLGAWPPADGKALAQRAALELLPRQLGWIGADGQTATVLVVVTGEGEAEHRALAALRQRLPPPPPGVESWLAGLPVLDRALDGSSQEIERRFFPLLVLFSVVLLAAAFRHLGSVAAPLAFVAFCQLTVLGTMGYLGVRLNLVLAVLPPLLYVIALATAVHLVVRCRQHLAAGLTTVAAVGQTVRDKGWAVVGTGLTTAAGFASLAVSRVGPVRTLGIWSGIGIALMTAAALVLLPALLASWAGSGEHRSHRHRLERRVAAAGRWLGCWATRHRGTVLVLYAAAVVAAAAGLPRLGVESNALTYLEPSHPARAGIEELERRGIGTAAVELVLSAGATAEEAPSDRTGDELGEAPRSGADGQSEVAQSAGSEEGLRAAREAGPDLHGATAQGTGADDEDLRKPSARDPSAGGTQAAPFSGDGLARLAQLSARLRRQPLVLGAVSAGDLVAAAAERAMVAPPGLGGAGTDPAALAAFLADDGRAARVTLFVPVLGKAELEPVMAAARAAAAELFPDARAEVTGQLPLLLETQSQLLSTLGGSLSLTFVCVALLLRLLLGTTRLTLLALAPSLVPVLAVLGGMGWGGLPLDVATVMVASVILGLAVDDTLHTLGHFRRLAPQHGCGEAVAATLERTAPAYLLTGFILVAGFGVCAFSSFAPTARFGLLSALGLALAVIGNFLLLPALLACTPRTAVAKIRGGGGHLSE